MSNPPVVEVDLEGLERPPGHCNDDGAWRDFSARYGPITRSQAGGSITDFELANAVFMASRDDLDLIHYQTAAKDRIRWLSVQLAKSLRLIELARSRQEPPTEAVPAGWVLVPGAPDAAWLMAVCRARQELDGPDAAGEADWWLNDLIAMHAAMLAAAPPAPSEVWSDCPHCGSREIYWKREPGHPVSCAVCMTALAPAAVPAALPAPPTDPTRTEGE